jgi:hypothetical protein
VRCVLCITQLGGVQAVGDRGLSMARRAVCQRQTTRLQPSLTHVVSSCLEVPGLVKL